MKVTDEFLVMQPNEDGSIDNNYYQSEWNEKGALYLMYDAKNHNFHLFVPESMTNKTTEMQMGVDHIVMTTGYGTGKQNRKFGTAIPNKEMVELMFEDNNNSPYMTYIGLNQCAYKFNDEFTKKGFDFVIHTKGKVFTMTCYVRSGGFRYELPCLKAIDTSKYEMI